MLSTLGETFKRFHFKYNPQKSNDSRIRYYECKNAFNFDSQMFPPVVRIEHDYGRYDNKKKSKYKIYFRNTKNWKTSLSTGLARYKCSWLFEGNISKKYEDAPVKPNGKHHENPKHFVLVQFSNDTKSIIVDVFENFYPFRLDFREQFIQEHKSFYKLKKRAV